MSDIHDSTRKGAPSVHSVFGIGWLAVLLMTTVVAARAPEHTTEATETTATTLLKACERSMSVKNYLSIFVDIYVPG